jgi:hypothetical protein
MDLPELATAFPKVRWQREARWVCEGKWLTSSGVAAGIDASLFLVEQLWGARVARGVCQSAEYVPCRDPSCDPVCGSATADWVAIRPARAARPLRAALLLYDNFELLDVFGPLECWAVANRFQAGLFFARDDRRDYAGQEQQGAVVPRGLGGGTGRATRGPRRALRAGWDRYNARAVPRRDAGLHPRARPARLDRVHSVHRLRDPREHGRAGRAGLRATTNKLSFNLMTSFSFGPRVRWDKTARFVAANGPEENFWTSSGVAAGIDMALLLLERQPAWPGL